MASAIHTIEASGVARFMREALYAYPVAEVVHIVGLGLLFGSIAIVDLRLLGLGSRVPVKPLVAFAVPWSIAGFTIAASAGLLMFTAHAEEFLTQPVFMLKMGLILAGGFNATILHVSRSYCGLASSLAVASSRICSGLRWDYVVTPKADGSTLALSRCSQTILCHKRPAALRH